MTGPLLTISAFARAVDLAPSALRYYDEAGLLPPAEVDPRTGYRYYTPALERRAQTIRRMREIGVPVETMRLVLNSSPERAAEILRGFAAQAAESARRVASAVADVVASLRAEDLAASPVVVTVDGPELAAALRRVSSAADVDSGSPLGVVLLDIAGSQLTLVATDRYWLAMWSMPLPGVHVGERRVVVPVGEVDGLAGWLSRQGMVTLSAAGDHTRVQGDDGEIAIATAEDRFPAYRLVLDDQPFPRGRVTVDRDLLLSAITGEASRVRLVVGRDRVTMSPQDGFEGAHLSAITSGEPVTVSFSAALLRSALTAMVGSAATLSYVAPDHAVQVTSADQRSFTALVMPVRLDE